MASHLLNFEKYNRPVKYWTFFAGGNSISRLRQKKLKEFPLKIFRDGILRSLEMINSDMLINSCSNRASKYCIVRLQDYLSDKQEFEFLILP